MISVFCVLFSCPLLASSAASADTPFSFRCSEPFADQALRMVEGMGQHMGSVAVRPREGSTSPGIKIGSIGSRIVVIVPFALVSIAPISVRIVIILRIGFVVVVPEADGEHAALVQRREVIITVIPISISQRVAPVVSVGEIGFVGIVGVNGHRGPIRADGSRVLVDIRHGICAS